MSGRRQIAAALAASAFIVAAVTTGAANAAKVSCPASASASAGPVQWAFSEIGAPQSGAGGANWSWTHGTGSWNTGAATGTICSVDKGPTIARRDLVLRVSGASTLSPRITRGGMLGVGIVLPVTVSASDDPACPAKTKGTVSLFATYYSTHVDTIALHFSGACADHDHTFSGAIVKVLIARNGAQVNST
ncbi:MAG TPA: hypothetical protein VKS25_06710 [Solirubrobacteraceae bacterium]|nr:hypothetical protein [Solirubrobacteraceae bacterium]